MSKKWTMPIQDWDDERSLESRVARVQAMNQFSILFGDRLKLDSF
ncbi:hypothetical protein LEP1GSC062_4059 [Leptospira alexanderi serovar Manhao 3 str. L 60]|nr:hypothetical protein LEP1GSC062_4059 [Leptospira alexanderi serovar Manhao 3 str. L 60]